MNRTRLTTSQALSDLRVQADLLQEHWANAKQKLDDEIAACPEGTAHLSDKVKFAGDYYNQCNEAYAAIQHRLAELERRETETAKFSTEKSISTEFEESTFWFRRFHTSLAIAHGAAFIAITSHLFEKDANSATASSAFLPLALFGVGMIFAGLIPVALHRRNGRIAWILASVSSALFASALLATLIQVWIKGKLALPVLTL